MGTDPKAWRVACGLSLHALARRVGIAGVNPARTYSRYERGESQCPSEIVERVRTLSQGAVGAEDWQRVRCAHLARSAPP